MARKKMVVSMESAEGREVKILLRFRRPEEIQIYLYLVGVAEAVNRDVTGLVKDVVYAWVARVCGSPVDDLGEQLGALERLRCHALAYGAAVNLAEENPGLLDNVVKKKSKREGKKEINE